jgi:MYND finger
MAPPQVLVGNMTDLAVSTPANPPGSMAPSDQSCVMCSRRGTKTCANCNHTKYCSVEHQKLDWPVHKLLCGAQQKFSEPPKAGMIRAILFPGGKEKPRFVWWPDNHNFMMIQTLDMDGHTRRFGSVGCQFSPLDLMETYTVSRNLIQNRKLDRAILVCRTRLQGGGRDPNQRILEMTRGSASFIWMAATIAFRLDSLCPPGNPSRYFEDIGVDDLRHLADFFTIAHRAEPEIIYKSIGDIGQKALGVRVRCQADMDQDATAKFKAVKISLKDMVFKQAASGITNLLGLPIQVRKFNEDETRSGSGFSNRSVMHFYLDVVSRRVLMNSNKNASKSEARPFDFLSDEDLQKNFDWVTGPKKFRSVDPQAKGFSVPGSSDSEEVTVLDMTMYESKSDIEEGILGFGSPPRTWLKNVGSVIAVRVDGKELLPKHLQVLCDFCEHKMGPLFTKMRQGGSEGTNGLSREDVLDEITRAKFIEFFKGYCTEKAVEDESWRGLKSPYDM